MIFIIKSDSAAGKTIEALTEKNGPAEFYLETLNNLQDMLIYHQDAFGLSDSDAMELIRVASLLRLDVQVLSKAEVTKCREADAGVPESWSELLYWSKMVSEAADEINQKTPSALMPEIRNQLIQLNKVLSLAVNGYNQSKSEENDDIRND